MTTDELRKIETELKKQISLIGQIVRESKNAPELGLFEEMQYLRRLRNYIENQLNDCELVAENPAEYSR